MGRLIGLAIFSLAIGMILTVLISNGLVTLILAIVLLIVSYHMIFPCK